jgi:hypothetical protein
LWKILSNKSSFVTNRSAIWNWVVVSSNSMPYSALAIKVRLLNTIDDIEATQGAEPLQKFQKKQDRPTFSPTDLIERQLLSLIDDDSIDASAALFAGVCGVDSLLERLEIMGTTTTTAENAPLPHPPFDGHHTCQVCMIRLSGIQITGCDHALCYQCARRLCLASGHVAPACPFCRHPMSAVKPLLYPAAKTSLSLSTYFEATWLAWIAVFLVSVVRAVCSY